MKRLFTLFFILVSVTMVFAQERSELKLNAVQVSGGIVRGDGHSSGAIGCDFFLYNFACGVDIGFKGGSKGEHKYGKGDVNEEPKITTMYLGYAIPTIASKCNLYLVPIAGLTISDYQYEDNYYGQAVSAETKYTPEIGGMAVLQKDHFIMSVKAGISGFMAGIGISF